MPHAFAWGIFHVQSANFAVFPSAIVYGGLPFCPDRYCIAEGSRFPPPGRGSAAMQQAANTVPVSVRY